MGVQGYGLWSSDRSGISRAIGSITNPAAYGTESAIAQAQLYAGGVLGDIELKRTRYIVIISPHRLGTLSDVEKDGITYRNITLPLTQNQPSVEARRRKDKR